MKALLVIDMQNVCVGKKHADCFKYDNERLLMEVNRVIDSASGDIVVYIKNIMKPGFINKFAPFQAYEGTEEVELVEGLHKVSDYVFEKYAGDAFSNEELDAFLKGKNVDEIGLVGVDGGGCVPLTAFGAIKRGYRVTIYRKAVGTSFEKKKEKFFQRLSGQGARFVD